MMKRLILILFLTALCFGQGRGLVFAAGGTDTVNVGSAAVLDNVATGTVICWCYPTNVTNATSMRIYTKIGTNNFVFVHRDTTNGDFRFGYTRSVTSLNILSPTGTVTVNTWQTLAATWNASGVNGDQHLYRGVNSGTLSTIAEIGSYTTQVVGSGTHDDASADAHIGSTTTSTGQFVGTIALVMICNFQMTVGQLRQQQFSPHKVEGCVGIWPVGINGTTSVPDWSLNGNAGTVTNTTTGIGINLIYR